MLWYCHQIIYDSDRRISVQEIISIFQICANLFDPKYAHLEKVYILTFHYYGSYVAETLAALFPKLVFQLVCMSFGVGSSHSNVVVLAKKFIEMNALNQKQGENLIQYIYIYRGRLCKSFFL